MAYRPVGTHKTVHRRIRMPHRDVPVSGILRLLRRPIQKGKVHQAVDDRPASRVVIGRIIPCADKIPRRVEASRQKIRRMQRRPAPFFIAGQTVIRCV